MYWIGFHHTMAHSYFSKLEALDISEQASCGRQLPQCVLWKPAYTVSRHAAVCCRLFMGLESNASAMQTFGQCSCWRARATQARSRSRFHAGLHVLTNEAPVLCWLASIYGSRLSPACLSAHPASHMTGSLHAPRQIASEHRQAFL